MWASNTMRLHQFMPTPSNSGQSVGLSRRAWTRLNGLRAGGFGANMLRWGLSTNDSCGCGAEQTADHITSGRCPIYRPPEAITGLIVLDDETRDQCSGHTSGAVTAHARRLGRMAHCWRSLRWFEHVVRA